ncbi:MAG TPA: hypothetical protein VGF48_17125 [Thermoanaerobaculia bacterium]|jgi:hypothetical protein
MSLFDFPRINFKGTLILNPGTANNDDYTPTVTMPEEWGPFACQPFGLVDSKMVRARTFGMSDEAFIAWIQQPQTLTTVPPNQPIMPAEWNYYGDMSSTATAHVTGIQTSPHQSYTEANPSVPITALLNEKVSFNGGITDINSEGSPPGTQFFIDLLTVGKRVNGQPTKGASQWMNFYRNVNLTADGGGGGYIYHVMRKEDGVTIDIPGFEHGLILRYYVYRTIHGTDSVDGLAKLFAEKKKNPATLEVVGTIAPLMPSDHIITGPVGRLLIQNTPNVKTPAGTSNNGAQPDKTSPDTFVALGPAVLQQNGHAISADFVGTFPDYYSQKTNENPKFPFGPVSLVVTGGGATVTVDEVNYADTARGDARGWLYDFDISRNPAAQTALKDPNATFSLVSKQFGSVLAETEYYFPTNQQSVYAEQHGPTDRFLNQGSEEPASFSVYRYGKQLDKNDCPPVTLWAYRATPLESPGNAMALDTAYAPGQPIEADTSQPGNILYTPSINGKDNPAPNGFPPQSYLGFQNPPWVTNAPAISVRILPNDEDFSRYYVDPGSAEPVGNELLTFQVLYEKVLRPYYLLYPIMNKHIPLNDEQAMKNAAGSILERTEKKLWMTTSYMPRTRDMSESRRKLLRAWCRKVS